MVLIRDPFTMTTNSFLFLEFAHNARFQRNTSNNSNVFVVITRQFIFCLISFSRVSRPGSVVAILQLVFGNSTIDPLEPLQKEISDGNLVSILVNPTLDVDPTSILPTATSMCVNTPFIAVYFWRGILGHLNFC